MAKRVVVIASGPTERSALPHLLAHLKAEGITVDIRIPDRHRHLRPNVVNPIIYSALYDSPDGPPHKIVVLVDTDGKSTDDAMRPIQQNIPKRCDRSNDFQYSLRLRSIASGGMVLCRRQESQKLLGTRFREC